MQYNARAKTLIIDALMESLYHLADTEFNTQLDNLIDENSIACGNDSLMMIFGDKLYISAYRSGGSRTPNRAIPALRAPLRKLIEERQEIEIEKATVRGYFQRVLMSTESLADCEEMLPPSLHSALHLQYTEFSELNKMLPRAFIDNFLQTNNQYVTLIKTRLMHNLMGNAA